MEQAHSTLLARIESLENLVMQTLIRSQQQQAAVANRSYVNDAVTSPTAPTNNMNLGIMAAAATVKAGGIFLAWVDMPFASGTNGDSVAFSFALTTGTGALTFTNGTQVAQAGNVQVSNAAAGISVATGASTVVTAALYNGTFPMLTGALGGNFSWFGLFSNSTLGDAAFPTGNNVVLRCTVSAAHSSTMTFLNPSMGLLELGTH
jgi:hypothetical protein